MTEFAGPAVVEGVAVRAVGDGTMFRGGTLPSSSSTSSKASLLMANVAELTGGKGRSGFERSGRVSPVSLAAGAAASDGLTRTMPPHLGQAMIWPMAARSRTFSRDLQVVQVRAKASTMAVHSRKERRR